MVLVLGLHLDFPTPSLHMHQFLLVLGAVEELMLMLVTNARPGCHPLHMKC